MTVEMIQDVLYKLCGITYVLIQRPLLEIQLSPYKFSNVKDYEHNRTEEGNSGGRVFTSISTSVFSYIWMSSSPAHRTVDSTMLCGSQLR
jgi:hypothetical protein